METIEILSTKESRKQERESLILWLRMILSAYDNFAGLTKEDDKNFKEIRKIINKGD